jgi:hypothetical protein
MNDRLGHIPSQTIGPFLHIAFHDATTRWAAPDGTAWLITVAGTVLDGAGAPVPDAMIETWQADGRLGRCESDDDGRYEIHTTIPPGGLLGRVVTRIYFGDDERRRPTRPTRRSACLDRVVGLSLGAMIAMRLATHHPDRVTSLALLCTSAQLGPPEAWHERAALVRAGGTQAVAQELPAITAPTLVFAGASDPATPPSHAEVIAGLVPGARLEIVPGAHFVAWEAAATVAALLADHLGISNMNDDETEIAEVVLHTSVHVGLRRPPRRQRGEGVVKRALTADEHDDT